MDSNKNTLKLNFAITSRSRLTVVALSFIALAFLSVYFSSPLPEILLAVVFLLSLAYVLTYVPSVFLLSAVAVSLPFSVIMQDEVSGFSIIFPSEFLGGVLACTMFLKFIIQFKFNTKFLFNPITLCIAGFLFFSFTSVLLSVSPLVSIKAVFIKCVYVAAFYLAAYDCVTTKSQHVYVFYLAYVFALFAVVLSVMYKHWQLDFDKSKVLLAVLPFFKDHTIYSACISFVIPVMAGIIINTNNKQPFVSGLCFLLVAILVVAVLFSYSRAAITSLLFLIPVLLILTFKIKLRLIAIVFSAVFFVGWNYSDTIFFYFKQNKNNSNERFADFEKQAKSITNISTDDSNAERINRWKCALRMFSEKPFTGYGLGTYQFEYFPFQRYYDITRISVFSPYNIIQQGRGGTAHSEYLLVLSEGGIFTFIFFVLLCISALLTGRKIYFKSDDKKIKIISLTVTAALFTYLFHGLFNNFLDTDKAAFLFYSAIGSIAALDNN